MKVVILSSVLFGAEETQAVRPHIHRAGISDLSEAAVRSALSDGGRWKLIGEGRMSEEGRPTLTVGPQLLPADDPLADVSGAANAVTFETDLLGEITIVGPGAGREETAFALLSDILAIHRKQAVEPSPRLEGASC